MLARRNCHDQPVLLRRRIAFNARTRHGGLVAPISSPLGLQVEFTNCRA